MLILVRHGRTQANARRLLQGRTDLPLDEIGRGTSTFDGLSLAWAVAHSIALDIGALTLFATHYCELTTLSDSLPDTRNVHLIAREYGDDIIFMYSVTDGPASQSYGLQVAKLAGVPTQVIETAREKLRTLEDNEIRVNNPLQPVQSDLFVLSGPDDIRQRITDLDVDSLSPREALELLYELKQEAKS